MAHKILILDDEESILRMMKELMSAKNFEVDVANTVAILDLGLSKIDRTAGLDMLSRVRRRSPGTRIIVFTGNEDPEVKQLAEQLGADLYLVKPGPIRKLSEAVYKFCGEKPDIE